MPDSPAGRSPRELARALVRPSRTHLLVAVILLLCGLVITMQVRSKSAEQDYSSLRRTELVAILDDLTAESRRLEAEIAELRNTQQQLRSGADRQQVALAEAERRRSMLAILGGTAPATGEGVRVVIADPNRLVGESTLLNAIGELRDAGAEVIEVNDSVRVVASTWIQARGGDLVMDGTTLERPLVLEAIDRVRAAAANSPVAVGILARDPEAARHWRTKGIQY
ncbi:MAG: DUF881 domain-containing protein, partial [Propionicimonas sp.]|nr:DUF881 domain-containing protein [Propionicimonas sp.]